MDVRNDLLIEGKIKKTLMAKLCMVSKEKGAEVALRFWFADGDAPS